MAATTTILDLVSVNFFFVGHWGNWRKVPFNGQRRRSSNAAAMAAILDFVSVDYLTNACRLVRFFGASPGAYATPCVALVVHIPGFFHQRHVLE
jgi:hypothetical protein